MATATTKNNELGDEYVEDYMLLLKKEGKTIREILNELTKSKIVYKGKPITFYKIQKFLKNKAKEIAAKAPTEAPKEVTVKEVIASVKTEKEEIEEVITEENNKEEAIETNPKEAIEEEIEEENNKEEADSDEDQKLATKENISTKGKESRTDARPKNSADLIAYMRNRS